MHSPSLAAALRLGLAQLPVELVPDQEGEGPCYRRRDLSPWEGPQAATTSAGVERENRSPESSTGPLRSRARSSA